MKRIKNLVIGGIQSKVFNLILVTVILLTAAGITVSLVQSNMLTRLTEESSKAQEEAIAETTTAVVDNVVEQSLERTNHEDAQAADAMFDAVRGQVTFLSDYAAKIFANPGEFAPKPYAGPDP